jgi:hypothetical protein
VFVGAAVRVSVGEGELVPMGEAVGVDARPANPARPEGPRPRESTRRRLMPMPKSKIKVRDLLTVISQGLLVG